MHCFIIRLPDLKCVENTRLPEQKRNSVSLLLQQHRTADKPCLPRAYVIPSDENLADNVIGEPALHNDGDSDLSLGRLKGKCSELS